MDVVDTFDYGLKKLLSLQNFIAYNKKCSDQRSCTFSLKYKQATVSEELFPKKPGKVKQDYSIQNQEEITKE